MIAQFPEPEPRGQASGPAADAAGRQIEILSTRLRELEADAEVAGAGQRWKFFSRARGNLVFVSETGRLAQIPEALAVVIWNGRRLDVELREEGLEIYFEQKGVQVARLPKAVVVQLGRLLGEVPGLDKSFPAGSQSQSRSQSHRGEQP